MLMSLSAPTRVILPSLQSPQHFCLCTGTLMSPISSRNNVPVCRFKFFRSFVWLLKWKNLFVSKQFTFDEFSGNGCTVHLHNRAVCPVAFSHVPIVPPVLFPHRFHQWSGYGHPWELLFQLFPLIFLWALIHQSSPAPCSLFFSAPWFPLPGCFYPSHCGWWWANSSDRWFGDIIISTLLYGLHGCFNITMTGDHDDDGDIGLLSPAFCKIQYHPVWHFDIA